jgi:purine-binding chemotaxis protein CheW
MTPEQTAAGRRTAALSTMVGNETEYVTLHIGAQLFGLPIDEVHEVFAANQITHVPLAPAAIKGLLNLRGRVVTAICLRTVLGMPEAVDMTERMAIGVDVEGEAYALLVDRIGDVMRLSTATHEANPIHLDENWQDLSRGVHRLETTILVVLDLERILGSPSLASAALVT